MTKDKLLEPFTNIHLQYTYGPTDAGQIHNVLTDTDEPGTSNVLGTDDESILEWLCYGAV